MKIRTDFVTNSSSASYVVDFRLRSADGASVTYSILNGERYEGYDPYKALFKWGWPIKTLDLWSMYLPKGGGMEELISDLIHSVHVEPFPENIILDQMRFFIAGEPQKYESRTQLEDVIRRNAGEVVDLINADFVILCGDDKERFCARWPWGYSIDEMDEAELHEFYAAEDRIEETIKKYEDFKHVWGLYTGACDHPYKSEMTRDDWRGWTLDDFIDPPLPVLSEEEFAFFDPNGPAGNGALSAMPGAVDALVKKCADAGITRENLLTVAARLNVRPFGDSWLTVEPMTWQWAENIPLGVHESAHEWAWQDTAWWPVPDEGDGTP